MMSFVWMEAFVVIFYVFRCTQITNSSAPSSPTLLVVPSPPLLHRTYKRRSAILSCDHPMTIDEVDESTLDSFDVISQ